MQSERRFLVDAEVRADGEGKKKLRGYASVFNAPYMIGPKSWGFEERVAPGAFAASIERGDDVRALWNHSPDHVLGRSKSGTLKLSEDERGLAVEIDPPDTQLGRDLVELVARGDVSQMSFAFRTVKDAWDESGEIPKRTLEQVDLVDVSLVTYPANEATEIALRDATASVLEGRKAAVEADLADRERYLHLLEIDAN